MTTPAADAVTLEVLRAEQGDCLLLFSGPQIVLVDGGPNGVYAAALQPRLAALMAERGTPLWLRMVLVSHIDDDHVVGLADMFADAAERQEEQRGPAQWRAGELWLNAFDDVTGAGRGPAGAGGRAAALNELTTTAAGLESRAIVVSIANGMALDRDAGALGVGRNTSFGGGLVQRGGPQATVELADGLTFVVVAPRADRLATLRTRWEAWERAHGPVRAREAANVDRSVFNLSSIVVLARCHGRTLLLTGDARSDDVIDGLADAGLLTGAAPLHVDLLKLPHHGSVRNVSDAFFARVRARHYVVSANGRDGNPEDETLRLLCESRAGDDAPWTLWLTYGGTAGDGRPGLHERLAAFFAGRAAAGQHVDVRFGSAGDHQTIEL